MTEARYEPEFAWTCAWSDGFPRPFLLVQFVASTRRGSIEQFIAAWGRDEGEPIMKAWRRAYRDGARCIRVSVSPWGYKASRPAPEAGQVVAGEERDG